VCSLGITSELRTLQRSADLSYSISNNIRSRRNSTSRWTVFSETSSCSPIFARDKPVPDASRAATVMVRSRMKRVEQERGFISVCPPPPQGATAGRPCGSHCRIQRVDVADFALARRQEFKECPDRFALGEWFRCEAGELNPKPTVSG